MTTADLTTLVTGMITQFTDGFKALLPLIAPVVIIVAMVFGAYRTIKKLAGRHN